ncbi:hypothetical protein HOF92_16315 [bacterium]|jgi:hypothetical protein|nr:hypothetical protein [bacterium]
MNSHQNQPQNHNSLEIHLPIVDLSHISQNLQLPRHCEISVKDMGWQKLLTDLRLKKRS